MKTLIASTMLGMAMLASPAALADHHEEHAAKYSVKTSTIGDLLDNPETLAIFEKHLPEIVSHPQIDMGRMMTLGEAQSYEPGMISDEKLEAMDADLAALH
ncbi:MAG: hypothetical protein CMK07_07860 [Ponticaulis sp.]|nr:hypothetical protein [Ponticaulis sp.]